MEMMARSRTEIAATIRKDHTGLDQLRDQAIKVPLSASADDVSLPLPHMHSSELGTTQRVENGPIDEYEHYLEPTAPGGISLSHGDAGDPELDLGIHVGKMWMTDRIGGLRKSYFFSTSS